MRRIRAGKRDKTIMSMLQLDSSSVLNSLFRFTEPKRPPAVVRYHMEGAQSLWGGDQHHTLQTPKIRQPQ